MENLNRHGYIPRPKPTAIPTAAWNDAPLFCLQVNDQWVSHMLGVLTALDQPDTWTGTPEEIDSARQQVNAIMVALMTACEEAPVMSYPRSATLWHDQATILLGGDLVRGTLAVSPYNRNDGFYNTISYQASVANGDTFAQSFFLDAGDYTFYALGGHNTANGKVDWYLDEAAAPFLAGQDWYAASLTPNIVKSGPVTIPEAGNHTLYGVSNGKHASAVAYAIPLTKYWFEWVP